MNRLLKQTAILAVLIILLVLPFFVFAATADTLSSLQKVAEVKGPYSTVDEFSMMDQAGKVVSIFLGALGVIFVVLILYAGYHWMTAAGDESKVEKAQETIKRAVIGLIILVSAYVIQAYIFGQLL